MAELEETWTNQSFYDRPLSVWTGHDADEKDAPVFDIYTASSIGNVHCIKDIIKQNAKAVEGKNQGGWTALMYASYYGHTEVVTLLLESQSPIHTRNNSGCNALMLSVVCGNEPVVEILIKGGSILETRDQQDWTVIVHAVSAGHHNVVDTLLKYGASPNACERGGGMTCLMYAAEAGDQHMVNILLKAGAVPTLKTHRGHTAARIANDAGNSNIASIITQYTHQGNASGPSIFDGPVAVANKMLQQQQLQHQQQQQQQQQHQTRSKGNSLPTIDNSPVIPSNLEAFLEQLSLNTYIPVLREQGVDLQLFLTLTDQDLKDCGIQKLGPRRKMTSAIARWHSAAPMRSTLEGAYADKLEVEMQELAVKLTDAQGAIQQAKTQGSQEKELRAVTEGWVVEARGRLQQCHQQCRTLNELVARAHQYITLVNMQAAAVVQHQMGQPTLASTIADTLAMIGSKVEIVSSLTDPNVARGNNNPNTPQVQTSDSGFTNQPTNHTASNVHKYNNGNLPASNHGPSGHTYNNSNSTAPNQGPSGSTYNNGNPPPAHHNRPSGVNYNNGRERDPRALHNGPGAGPIYNNGNPPPPPSQAAVPNGNRYNNDNINNNPPFPRGGPYKPSNPHSNFHTHISKRMMNN